MTPEYISFGYTDWLPRPCGSTWRSGNHRETNSFHISQYQHHWYGIWEENKMLCWGCLCSIVSSFWTDHWNSLWSQVPWMTYRVSILLPGKSLGTIIDYIDPVLSIRIYVTICVFVWVCQNWSVHVKWSRPVNKFIDVDGRGLSSEETREFLMLYYSSSLNNKRRGLLTIW